jgi:polysaccharide biosynthesis protein PslG
MEGNRIKYLICAVICAAVILCFSFKTSQDGSEKFGPLNNIAAGVNIHFTAGHEKDLDMIKAAGFRYIRTDLVWQEIEYTRGVYDWKAYDELTANLNKHGLRAIYILDYSNSLYEEIVASKDPVTGEEIRDIAAPVKPGSISAFTRWAREAAIRYKDNNVVWEIWNEPNISFWRPVANVEQYNKLALAVCTEIKSAVPNSVIIGPATSGIPFPFLESFLASGVLKYLDGVSIHPYRDYSLSPESAADEYRKLSDLIKHHTPGNKKSIPIISSEWGYASCPKGVTVEKQACLAVRMQLANLLNGVPVSIWYDWKNDGESPTDFEHNCGTVTFDLEPKRAYNALSTMNHQLKGYTLSERIKKENANDYILSFINEKGNVRICAWTTDKSHSVRLELTNHDKAIIEAVDGYGYPLNITSEKDSLILELTDLPQYLTLSARPISLHPLNHHYFIFRGKPEILITSAEHYGAVVNGEFNYEKYLDALQSYGLNYTRIYPGALFEPVDKFISGNTLGVNPEKLVLPWSRSNKPGYCLGGNLFDLDNWNSAYFDRLKDFIKMASSRGIVIEICFFNCQYKDTWPISPLYFKNNIQGEGNCTFNDTQTLLYPDVAHTQSEYVKKIVQEVNSFDNVILEICDEPILFDTPDSLAGLWIKHMVNVIKETEKPLPLKHLIAQQIEGKMDGPVDFSNDPDVQVIVTQYDWAAGDQMGGLKGLDFEYGHNKVIELNETDYYPVWYGEGNDKIGASRVEAWEFIVGGGAGFNQLNGLYTVKNPSGTTDDNKLICTSLSNLGKFMHGFDFIKMRQDKNFVIHGIPDGTFYRCLSEPGRQYALYIHHSIRKGESYYFINPGNYRENIVLSLPEGSYQVEWINPADGRVLLIEKVEVKGYGFTLTTPRYTIDIALRVKRI